MSTNLPAYPYTQAIHVQFRVSDAQAAQAALASELRHTVLGDHWAATVEVLQEIGSGILHLWMTLEHPSKQHLYAVLGTVLPKVPGLEAYQVYTRSAEAIRLSSEELVSRS